jgi:hypothetical protein
VARVEAQSQRPGPQAGSAAIMMPGLPSHWQVAALSESCHGDHLPPGESAISRRRPPRPLACRAATPSSSALAAFTRGARGPRGPGLGAPTAPRRLRPSRATTAKATRTVTRTSHAPSSSARPSASGPRQTMPETRLHICTTTRRRATRTTTTCRVRHRSLKGLLARPAP